LEGVQGLDERAEEAKVDVTPHAVVAMDVKHYLQTLSKQHA
jgi:hypothetical protein